MLVACYLPQALVLAHCTAVVSHVGAGTRLGALCFGLPQLALPQGTDSRITRRRWSPLGPVSRSHLGDHPRRDCRVFGPGADGAGIRSHAEAIRAKIAGMHPADAVRDEREATVVR